MPLQYPHQFWERALRMVDESLPEHETESAAMKKVVSKLGISPKAIRRWKRQSEVDSGLQPGISAKASEEIKHLKCENLELRSANEIAKKHVSVFRN